MGGVQSGLYNTISVSNLGNLTNKVSLTGKATLGYPYCKGNLKRYKKPATADCVTLLNKCLTGPEGTCDDPSEIFGNAAANKAHWAGFSELSDDNRKKEWAENYVANYHPECAVSECEDNKQGNAVDGCTINKVVDGITVTINIADINEGNKEDLKKYFKNLKEKLYMALKLNLLYDSYQNNNKIISQDIKKKEKNQEKDFKKLSEDRDKLKNLIDIYKNKINSNDFIRKYIIYTLIFFSIIILILISYIVYKKYYSKILDITKQKKSNTNSNNSNSNNSNSNNSNSNNSNSDNSSSTNNSKQKNITNNSKNLNKTGNTPKANTRQYNTKKINTNISNKTGNTTNFKSNSGAREPNNARSSLTNSPSSSNSNSPRNSGSNSPSSSGSNSLSSSMTNSPRSSVSNSPRSPSFTNRRNISSESSTNSSGSSTNSTNSSTNSSNNSSNSGNSTNSSGSSSTNSSNNSSSSGNSTNSSSSSGSSSTSTNNSTSTI